MLLRALASLGRSGINTSASFGRAGLMLFNALIGRPEPGKQWPLLLKQLYSVGVQSLLIIMVSGLFIGMVLGLQGYIVLTTYSAEASLGMMVALSLRRIVAPRFWAGMISMPLLTIIFVAIGIWGGSVVGVDWKGIDSGFFWSAMQGAVEWKKDLLNCLIKSVVFAITVTWIAIFNGYDAVPTSEGISRATTRTVVHSSLAVLGLDFVLTALMFGN